MRSKRWHLLGAQAVPGTMLSALHSCFGLNHTIRQYSSVPDLLKEQFYLVQPNTF